MNSSHLRKTTILLSTIILVFLSSCNDLMQNQQGGGTNNPNVSSSISGHTQATVLQTNKGELKAKPRFYTEINANGTFKPGVPIQLSLSVRARVPTKNANIKLFLPEITALKQRKAGGKAKISVGEPLKPQFSWSQRLSQGEVLRKQKTITVSQPGYYHIFLAANTEEGEKFTERGQPVKNSTSNNLWVWVAKDGGKITQEYDSTLISKNYRNQLGPLTKINDPQIIRFTHNGKIFNSTANAITLDVSYLNITSPTSYEALKEAQVQYQITMNGNPIYSNTGYTNENGIFTIPCNPQQNLGYTAYIYTQNQKLKVSNNINNGTSALPQIVSGSTAADCGSTISVQSNLERSHLFEVMNTAIENSRSFFQKNRGLINVYAYDTGGGSYYSRGDDAISIYNKDSNNNTIGGGYGDFTAAHEYGHALHEKGLGGNEGGHCADDDDDDDGHNVYEAISLRCAFSEGFADYHADAVGFPYFSFKTNPYVNNGEDGAIIEGAVAAFYWDMTDPANESFDNAEYPGSYIANTIEDCEVDGNRANGVDNLIACFQHSIPDYTNYFPTRNSVPSSYNENVTEPSGWNQTDIRKLWYKNLYDDTYTL